MLLLPTFNARLNPCPVSAATAFTPHAQGHFCGQCQRVVQDFSQSENPVADLAAARAASPDGRVCGTFRKAQLVAQPSPTLSRRLRWFVMTLVLVVGQGLTAREALAQVRKPVPKHHTTVKKQSTKKPPTVVADVPEIMSGITEMRIPTWYVNAETGEKIYSYVEQMPQLPGGNQAIVAYIQQRVQRPAGAGDTEGRVDATFIVGKDGQVRDARVVRGLHPLLDTEALRIIQTLPVFEPGQQDGQPVAVSFTVPVKFQFP